MKGRELIMAAVLAAAVTGQAHAASQLRLGSVLGEGSADGFARAERPRAFELPEDHAPHPRYRSEWWYLTASLDTAEGDAFGVQFTLFRQALRPQPVIGGPWDATQIYLAHLAVTDVSGDQHLEAERISRGHPRLAGVTVQPFRAHLDGWTLRAPAVAAGAAGEPSLDEPFPAGLVLEGATAAFAVRLHLDPRKGVVLQGENGLSAKGPSQASYYYSVPRLAAEGEIRVGEETARVRGTAWLDREWSTSVLGESQSGWDWFALHLDSGAELMAFQLRNESGLRDPYDQGVWVSADGESHQLRTQDFTLEPIRYWEDAEGTRWPVAWALSVMTPDGPRQLEVRAAVDDQRMDTLLTYWEGLVWVYDRQREAAATGDPGGGRRVGTGYMELTGYE